MRHIRLPPPPPFFTFKNSHLGVSWVAVFGGAMVVSAASQKVIQSMDKDRLLQPVFLPLLRRS
jgi:hypothetical protein